MMDAVCARPEIPPKDRNWIASKYRIFSEEKAICDNRVIPLVISRLPTIRIAGNEVFCHSRNNILDARENRTI